jgi:hypothetical protein
MNKVWETWSTRVCVRVDVAEAVFGEGLYVYVEGEGVCHSGCRDQCPHKEHRHA